jgi:hypothetical protein
VLSEQLPRERVGNPGQRGLGEVGYGEIPLLESKRKELPCYVRFKQRKTYRPVESED